MHTKEIKTYKDLKIDDHLCLENGEKVQISSFFAGIEEISIKRAMGINFSNRDWTQVHPYEKLYVYKINY